MLLGLPGRDLEDVTLLVPTMAPALSPGTLAFLGTCIRGKAQVTPVSQEHEAPVLQPGRHILSCYSVPGTELGTGDTEMSRE